MGVNAHMDDMLTSMPLLLSNIDNNNNIINKYASPPKQYR